MMKKIAISILTVMILGAGTTLISFGKSIISLEKDTIHNASRIEKTEKNEKIILDRIDQVQTNVLSGQIKILERLLDSKK